MEYKKYNDYELIYMVRESDDFSKDILYEKYLPVIKSISKEYYLKFRDYGYDYDDFFQEASILFEKAVINYSEDRESVFYTFVNICIRRGLLTFCRSISNENKNKPLSQYIDLDISNIPDKKNDINTYLNEYDFNAIISNIMLKFPIEYSSVLELKYNGFNYREISILLNIPSSTAEYRIRKIKKELNRYYCK